MRRGKRHARYRSVPTIARCPFDGKTTFRRYDDAAGAAGPHGSRAYWCAHAGGYHITASTAGDYQRTRQRMGT